MCLARAGYEVELIERSSRLEAVGAGLQLSPNALRVLAQLELIEALRQRGVSARSVTLRSGRSGRPLASVPVQAEDGTPYLSILRADLQAVLLAAVESDPRIRLSLGESVVSLEADGEESHTVVTIAASGEQTRRSERRLVIAADGVHSAVASALSLGAPMPSGLSAYRMMLDSASPSSGIEAWLGRGHHAVAYPVAGGAKTNLVSIGPSMSAGDVAAKPIDRAELLRRFSGWDPMLLRLFEKAGPIAVWPLLEADRMNAPLPQGVILIGDSAHAMLPFAAQGAAMAIEDAAVLAATLRMSGSFAEAAAMFRHERKARIEAVRRRVAFHRFVYHLPMPLSWGRNAALALRPQSSLRRDLAWLYDWTPPTFEAH